MNIIDKAINVVTEHLCSPLTLQSVPLKKLSGRQILCAIVMGIFSKVLMESPRFIPQVRNYSLLVGVGTFYVVTALFKLFVSKGQNSFAVPVNTQKAYSI